MRGRITSRLEPSGCMLHELCNFVIRHRTRHASCIPDPGPAARLSCRQTARLRAHRRRAVGRQSIMLPQGGSTVPTTDSCSPRTACMPAPVPRRGLGRCMTPLWHRWRVDPAQARVNPVRGPRRRLAGGRRGREGHGGRRVGQIDAAVPAVPAVRPPGPAGRATGEPGGGGRGKPFRAQRHGGGRGRREGRGPARGLGAGREVPFAAVVFVGPLMLAKSLRGRAWLCRCAACLAGLGIVDASFSWRSWLRFAAFANGLPDLGGLPHGVSAVTAGGWWTS